jgi:tRNA pseudouridine55 synthase
MNGNLPENILLVDKPKGITSFDVIRRLRVKLGIRKMGHAGTLDPLASGLMIIGINDGTKKMTDFLKLPKTYVADILLGKKSETGDMEGKIVEEKSTEGITDDMIQKVVANFVGKHNLAVPMYSAIKVGGRPLYSIARKVEEGKTLTEKETNAVPPVKEMEVISIKLIESKREPSLEGGCTSVRVFGEDTECGDSETFRTGVQPQSGDESGVKLIVEMRVSSGSYIRTLAEELGNRLGVPAMLTDLRRTEIGEYSVKDAMSI